MFPVVHPKTAMRDAVFINRNSKTAMRIFLINRKIYIHTNNIGRGNILFDISFSKKSEANSIFLFNK